MPNYKDQSNKVHFIESDEFACMLPSGSVRINDEEAAALSIKPTKEDRISVLQSAYDSDLDKLNKAWLVALIADGEGEVVRQAALKAQMQDLADQLDMDILTIIMEE